MNESYLAHYQVKGAKHGVRRYQYEDGSLTPLGRVHYGIGLGKHRTKTEATGNESANKEDTEKVNRPKTISEMTDEELNKAISRKQLEKKYEDLFTIRSEEKISWGKQFTDNLKDKAAVGLSQVVVNAGSKWVEKKLNKALGIPETKEKNSKENSSTNNDSLISELKKSLGVQEKGSNAIPKWIEKLSDEELDAKLKRATTERNLYKAIKG